MDSELQFVFEVGYSILYMKPALRGHVYPESYIEIEHRFTPVEKSGLVNFIDALIRRVLDYRVESINFDEYCGVLTICGVSQNYSYINLYDCLMFAMNEYSFWNDEFTEEDLARVRDDLDDQEISMEDLVGGTYSIDLMDLDHYENGELNLPKSAK